MRKSAGSVQRLARDMLLPEDDHVVYAGEV